MLRYPVKLNLLLSKTIKCNLLNLNLLFGGLIPDLEFGQERTEAVGCFTRVHRLFQGVHSFRQKKVRAAFFDRRNLALCRQSFEDRHETKSGSGIVRVSTRNEVCHVLAKFSDDFAKSELTICGDAI